MAKISKNTYFKEKKMVNRKNLVEKLVLVLVFGFVVIGCDIPEPGDEERIIGEWDAWPMTNLKFHSDGTVDFWCTGWGTETYNYKLNNNILEITDFNGNSGTGTVRFETVDNIKTIRIYNFVSNIGHLAYIERTYTRK